jgi:hypothetical protein
MRVQNTYVIFDYSCAMDRKTKCIPMFLFYGFSSCDSSIRSALLYQWPLLLSGGSPCCIGRESNPEPTVPYGTFNGTRQQYECLRQCLAPFKLTWEHGPGLSWSQVLFTNSTIHIHIQSFRAVDFAVFSCRLKRSNPKPSMKMVFAKVLRFHSVPLL